MTQARLIKVARNASVVEGAATIVKAEELTLALFRVGGRCYAISNTCPHRGGPLGEGELEGPIVHCPWHGWSWDVRTGTNIRQPNVKKVECFPVTVVDDDLYVEVASPPAAPSGG